MAINVDDVDRALAFYVDVLGLVARTDRPDFGFGGAWLNAGQQQVHLEQARPPSDQGQHFALLVDDLGATITELRAGGVTVSDAFPAGSARQAFLNDPAGNTIELHEPAS
ncbi:MAG: VOC family protein [Actinomycetota bacterium]|nr:VOC family protein [Actinomycetota bacterium]